MHYALAVAGSTGAGAVPYRFEFIDAETFAPCLDRLPIDDEYGMTFKFSSDGRWLLIEQSGRFVIYDLSDWSLFWSIEPRGVYIFNWKTDPPTPILLRTDTPRHAMFSKDGRYVFVVYNGSIYNPDTYQFKTYTTRFTIFEVASKSIYYSTHDDPSYVWNPLPSVVACMDVSYDNRWWLMSFDDEVLMFDIANKQFASLPFTNPFAGYKWGSGFRVAKFSPDNRYLALIPEGEDAVADYNTTPWKIVDMTTWTVLDMEFIEQFDVNSYGFGMDVEFTKDSRYLIFAFYILIPSYNSDRLTDRYDGPFVLDLQTWKLVKHVEPAREAQHKITMHPDGRHCAMMIDAGWLRDSSYVVYDMTTWQIVGEGSFFWREADDQIIDNPENRDLSCIAYSPVPMLYSIQGDVLDVQRRPASRTLTVIDEETEKTQITTEMNGEYNFSFLYPNRKSLVIFQPESNFNDFIASRIKPT